MWQLPDHDRLRVPTPSFCTSQPDRGCPAHSQMALPPAEPWTVMRFAQRHHVHHVHSPQIDKFCVARCQMVLPAAGPRAVMRFAQRRAGPGTSSVSASGQSDVLFVRTSTVGVDALVQVQYDLNYGVDNSIFSLPRAVCADLHRQPDAQLASCMARSVVA